MTLRKKAPRARQRWLGLLAFVTLGLLLLATTALGTVSSDAGFEGADGNLAPNGVTPNFDWNSFSTTSWTGMAPYRTSTKLSSGWEFTGLEDAQTDGNDTVFAGGTKQDDDCATVKYGPKPPNKDDLKRIYIANSTQEVIVEGVPEDHVFLALAWVRIPQNTTSASAHVAFEFNQGDPGSCPNTAIPGNDGLVAREEGDMLVVYDFEGSSTDSPSIELSRWITSGTCEVGSNSPPCWGDTQVLTDLGFAEGKVNTSDVGSASDTISPTSPTAESLGDNEFGEAIIDLTAAEVFPVTPTSCLNFGRVFGVSRSSGNSAQAQMKDLVGPGDISISNCASVIIRKETDPDEEPNATLFGYTKDFDTDPATSDTFTLTDDGVQSYSGTVFFGDDYTVTEDVIPAGWDFFSVDCSGGNVTPDSIVGATVTFDIDSENDTLDCTYTNKARATVIVEKITDDGFGSFDFTSGTLGDGTFTLTTTAAGAAGSDSETFSDLLPGTYDVAETVPSGWNLVSSTCDDGSDPSSIGLSAGETVTCTFHDARERGAIEITKTRKYASATEGDPYSQPHPGVDFVITGGLLPAEGTTVTTDANGVACLDGLLLSVFAGNYTVTETVPDGYSSDDPDGTKTVTVTTESTCGDGNEDTVSFSNTPLTDLDVTATSQDPGATKSTIECEDSEGNPVGAAIDPAEDPAAFSVDDLLPGTYTCTIVIDP